MAGTVTAEVREVTIQPHGLAAGDRDEPPRVGGALGGEAAGAGHRFEEPDTLDQVVADATGWFGRYLGRRERKL